MTEASTAPSADGTTTTTETTNGTNPVYEWFLRERGLTKETLDAFNVVIDKGGDVIYPYDTGQKTRPNPTKPLGDRKRFYFTRGKVPVLFKPAEAELHHGKVAFLAEGETDAMRLWQELGESDSGTAADVYGLPGTSTWYEGMADVLCEYDTVFVVFDNDPDHSPAATEAARIWGSIRNSLGTRARRLQIPDGVKDLCEFFEVYDTDTLRSLAKRNTMYKSRWKPLDFTKPPPPPNWLIRNLIAKGDVTVVHGREGLGKSWFTMDLAVALAEGKPLFIGMDVLHKGRVLYIDQENPEDDIHRRVHALGLAGAANRGTIRYLWNQGIKLDKRPTDLLEEAMEFEPELIVVDSLTRVHTQDENSVGAMSALYNDGIQPLARATGASVIVIHHDNKGGDSRGSVDITAAADNVLHMVGLGEDNPAKFKLIQGKTRRRKGGEVITVEITDQPDGSVTLEPHAEITPPF